MLTPDKALSRPGLGVSTRVHLAPFQRSASVLAASVCPTAQALEAERTLTALRLPASLVTAPAGPGWLAPAISDRLRPAIAKPYNRNCRPAARRARSAISTGSSRFCGIQIRAGVALGRRPGH